MAIASDRAFRVGVPCFGSNTWLFMLTYFATSTYCWSSDSGSCHIPHLGSGCPINSRCRAWYSSLSRSQAARLPRRIRPTHRTRSGAGKAGTCALREPPSSLRLSTRSGAGKAGTCALREPPSSLRLSTRSGAGKAGTCAVGEPQRDLALGQLRRIGAVHQVVRHRQREIAANRPRRRRAAGFVEPIVERTTAIAPSPSSTSASVGAEVMNSTSSPKNGFSVCSA